MIFSVWDHDRITIMINFLKLDYDRSHVPIMIKFFFLIMIGFDQKISIFDPFDRKYVFLLLKIRKTFFRIQIDINFLNKVLNEPLGGKKCQK